MTASTGLDSGVHETQMPARVAWSVQEGESAKAFAWFQRYLDLGPARSIRKLREAYGKKVSYERQLEEYSRRHAWVTRARAWDTSLHAPPTGTVREPTDATPYLPRRDELPALVTFHQAREAHADRLRQILAARAPCLVEVTYHEEPAFTEELASLHTAARHRERTPLLLIEYRPRGAPVEWLGMTILQKHDAPQAHSHVDFFTTYLTDTYRASRAPDARWDTLRRKARQAGRTPVLVTCKHGSRSGTILAPLTWFLKPTSTESA